MRLREGSPRRAYDILVRMPSRVTQNGAASLARHTDLAELAGSITLAQYDTIRQLPGVQVAAPVTMIGYVPPTVVIPFAVRASAITTTPELFTVTSRQRADDGLTSATEPDAGSTCVTASATCPVSTTVSSLAALPVGRAAADDMLIDQHWPAAAGLVRPTASHGISSGLLDLRAAARRR